MSDNSWEDIEVPDYVEPRMEETRFLPDPMMVLIETFKEKGKLDISNLEVLEKALCMLKRDVDDSRMFNKMIDCLYCLSLEEKERILLSVTEGVVEKTLRNDPELLFHIRSKKLRMEEEAKLSDEEKENRRKYEAFLQREKEAIPDEKFLRVIEDRYHLRGLKTDLIESVPATGELTLKQQETWKRDTKLKKRFFRFLEEASADEILVFLRDLSPYRNRWFPLSGISYPLGLVVQKLSELYGFYNI